jgi:8-oxo-dGTP pyrophosphatase MutT (NUDIX family)
MPRVVTCLLVNADGKLLVLKRSDKVKTYKGLWGGVAGYIEEDEEPYETALKEISEETGLKENDIDFIKKIDSVKFIDFYEGKRYDWEVFPFLFKTRKKDKIHIDWEHSEYRWITPSEIGKIDTVPHLKEIIFKVLQ